MRFRCFFTLAILVTLSACEGGDDDAVALPDAVASGDANDAGIADAATASDASVPDVLFNDALADAQTVDAGSLQVALGAPLRLGADKAVSQACGVATDGEGNVYVVGQTNGGVWGRDALGRRDLFLARVLVTGQLDWVQQLGDKGTGLGIFTGGCAVAVGTEGEAYVAGTANGAGSLAGQALPAVFTGFAARYDRSGTRRWLTLLGDGPQPTEAMSIDFHAGAIHVLGWTEASLGGHAPRGQGDVFLSRLHDTTGAQLKAFRFGSAVEDVPMGLVRDGAGLWMGFKRHAGRLVQLLGHELVHLSAADDAVLHHLKADVQEGFTTLDFAVDATGDPVMLGATFDGQQQGYAFRVHHRNGILGPVVAGARADVMQARAFRCGPQSCAVAGQQFADDQEGSVVGFVHQYSLDLQPGVKTAVVAKGESAFTAAAALAFAPHGHWLVAGWSGATLFGQPPVGPRDGVAFRVGTQGQVVGVE